MTPLHGLDWPKIRRDLGMLFFSQLAYKLASYGVLMVLTRHFAKDEIGEFFFALSIATSAALATELGLNQDLVRETARRSERALDFLGQALAIRLPIFALYFAGLAVFALTTRPAILDTLLLVGAFVALEQIYLIIGSMFVGIRRVHYTVAVGLLTRTVLVLLVLGVARGGGGLHAILGAHIAANALLVGAAALIVQRRIGPLRLRRPDDLRRVLGRSLPLFALTVLGTLHFNVDTVMLGFLRPYSEVATYNVAFRLLEAAQILVRPLLMIFLPLCAGLAIEGRFDALTALYRRMLLYAGGTGVALAVGALVGAGVAIPLLFGAAYASSAPLLRVLYLAVPALYANAVAGVLARSLDLERSAVAWMTGCVLLNVVLNAVTIPRWGAVGAAWSSVVSQSLLAAVLMRLNLRALARPVPAVTAPEPLSAAETAGAI